MKRYAGDVMTAYVGVMCILLTVGSFVFATIILTPISAVTVLLSIYCFICSIMCGWLTVHCSDRAFSWCELSENEITITAWFKKPYTIQYRQCTDVGIGYYIHGVLNSNLGTKQYFIYFSLSRIEDEYKTQINRLAPSKTCVKLGYNKKTYQYLMKHLPKSQAIMLAADARKLRLKTE